MKGFRGKKSDRVDAKNIAMQVEFGNGRDAMPYDDLRELVSRYWFLRKEVVRIKARIRRDLFLLGKDSRVTKALLVSMSSLNSANPTESDLVFLSRLLLSVLDEKKKVEGEIRSRVPRDHVLLTIPGITSLSAGFG